MTFFIFSCNIILGIREKIETLGTRPTPIPKPRPTTSKPKRDSRTRNIIYEQFFFITIENIFLVRIQDKTQCIFERNAKNNDITA